MSPTPLSTRAVTTPPSLSSASAAFLTSPTSSLSEGWEPGIGRPRRCDFFQNKEGGLSTSPFEKLWVSSKNQIVKSPFEKDYNLSHTLYPFEKGLCSPSLLSDRTDALYFQQPPTPFQQKTLSSRRESHDDQTCSPFQKGLPGLHSVNIYILTL